MKAVVLYLLIFQALGAASAVAQSAGPGDPFSAPRTRVRVRVSSTATVSGMIELVDPTMAGEPWTKTGAGAALERSGRVVLVVPRPGSLLMGTFVRQDERAIVLVPDRRDSVVTVPRAAIVQLERSSGEGWGRVGHAGVGALLGAGIGALTGLTAAGSCSSGQLCLTGASVVGGALLGAGGGALIGVALPAERWVPVSPDVPIAALGGQPHPLEVAVASGRPGLRIGLRPTWRLTSMSGASRPLLRQSRPGFGGEVIVAWSRRTGPK